MRGNGRRLKAEVEWVVNEASVGERVSMLRWLQRWRRRPRRVFWVFDLDSWEWREVG